MFTTIRRRVRTRRLYRAAKHSLRTDERAARTAGRGSPVAAALSTNGSYWSAFAIDEHADGAPVYYHPGSVAGPGMLIRQRPQPPRGGKSNLLHRMTGGRR